MNKKVAELQKSPRIIPQNMKTKTWLMTPVILLAGMLIAADASADLVIAAWEFRDGSGNVTANSTFTTNGIGTSQAFSQFVVATNAANAGSTDGTFGTGTGLDRTASTALNGLRIGGSNSNVTRTAQFSVTNNGASALNLSGFHFDYGENGGAYNLKVEIVAGGGISSAVLYNQNPVNTTGFSTTAQFDHSDLSFDLTSLADRTLAVGEGVTFKFTADMGATSGPVLLDNIAVSIPEPATLGLFVLSGTGLLLIRRHLRR
jgi:hypothetical protein